MYMYVQGRIGEHDLQLGDQKSVGSGTTIVPCYGKLSHPQFPLGLGVVDASSASVNRRPRSPLLAVALPNKCWPDT